MVGFLRDDTDRLEVELEFGRNIGARVILRDRSPVGGHSAPTEFPCTGLMTSCHENRRPSCLCTFLYRPRERSPIPCYVVSLVAPCGVGPVGIYTLVSGISMIQSLDLCFTLPFRAEVSLLATGSPPNGCPFEPGGI
jgi:hypothetical protein